MTSEGGNELEVSMWALFKAGKFRQLKALCPESFRWEGVVIDGFTALQVLVDMCMPVEDGADQKSIADICDMASWLMTRGASIHALGSGEECSWGSLTLHVDGETAISSLTNLMHELQTCGDRVDWDAEIGNLDKLLDTLLCHQPQNAKVAVDESVLNFWDGLLRDESTHDVVLETTQGAVGAHRLVLSGASSVLRAMLSSGMREGQNQRIQCEDVSKEEMLLLLDLVYTGSTELDVTLDSGSGAFDLAHRWDVKHALPMLERLLAGLLNDESFERIGELAVAKGSRDFEQAVGKWGNMSKRVQRKLEANKCSPALRKLLGKDDAATAPSRKRKSF
jgi:hypothetical protein